MCVYNGRRVSLAEFIRLKEMEKSLKALEEMEPRVGYGYDYGDWPIVRPTPDGEDFEIMMAHWEFLPPMVESSEALYRFRQQFDTLNAKGETLLQSPLYRNAALHSRCLVLSWGFWEYRHLPQVGKRGKVLKTTLKIPYHITVKDQSPFFMAGVYQQTVDGESGEVVPTFAIVTTEANALMAQVHNSKKRMPVILPEKEATEWLFGDLRPGRITELATFQYPSENLQAWPVRKDFRQTADPATVYEHDGLPQLVL